MSGKTRTLPFDGRVKLIDNLVDDLVAYAHNDATIPSKRIYKVAISREHNSIQRDARSAAMRSIGDTIPSIKKIAFDTRRINQQTQRIPRPNLQYWNRSQQFVDDECENSVKALSNLLKPLENIKIKYGHHPEYFQSYARSLHDSVKRAVKVSGDNLEIFKPQLDYLEQLVFARYRLSMEDLEKLSTEVIYDRIIKRDEELIRRDAYLRATSNETEITVESEPKKSNNVILKDSDKTGGLTQDSIVNAIFGNNKIRRDGEKKVERTITITIRDEVVD